MSAKRLLLLRVMVIIILVLLAFQFELGMAVNIANPLSIPPFGLSLNGVSNALHLAGGIAVVHASLGVWLVIFSLVSIIFSLRSGVRSVQVFGILASWPHFWLPSPGCSSSCPVFRTMETPTGWPPISSWRSVSISWSCTS